MKASIKVIVAIFMFCAPSVYAAQSDDFKSDLKSDNLKSVEEIENESAILGFLGLVGDIATNGRLSGIVDIVARDDGRDRDGRRDDGWDRNGRGRRGDRRDERCRRYGDCGGYNPGYPGYPPPGRNPGYPGYQPPGRYPGYPGYPPPSRNPGYPRDYYVCYAVNARGDYFTAADWYVRYAQDSAMQNCYRNSYRCEERGCERVRVD